MVVKTEIYFATRKTANAHVFIKKGVGKVRVNNVPIDMVEPEMAREVILVPLEISGEIRNKIDISVRVSGGGFMGQSYAAATAITRALIGWTKNKRDPKDLISGDARRKEPKKFGGPGARRRKQKSYR
jgi:small subunit ribosomal protein S9